MCVADNALQLALVCSTSGAAAGSDYFGLPEARRLAIRHGYVFEGVAPDACDAKRADVSGKRHHLPAALCRTPQDADAYNSCQISSGALNADAQVCLNTTMSIACLR